MPSPDLTFSFDPTRSRIPTQEAVDGLVYTANGGLTLVSGMPVSGALGYGGFGNDPFVNGPLRSANGGLIPQTLTTAVYENLHLVAGTRLNIQSLFVPGDYAHRDEAVALLKDNATGAIVSQKIADVQDVINNTGVLRYTTFFNVAVTGDYNLLVGVADIGDAMHPSTLKIEDLSVDVPANSYTVQLGGIRLADGSVLGSDGSLSVGGVVRAGVLSDSGAGLVAGLTSLLASGVISNDGGSLISQDGGGVVSNDGGSLISQDGGGLISQDGGGLISQDGGGLVGNAGCTLGAISAAQLAQLGASLQQSNGFQVRAFAAASSAGLAGGTNYGLMSADGGTPSVPQPTGTYVAPVPGLEVDASAATALRYDSRSAVADLGAGRYVVAFAEYDVLPNGGRAYSIRAQVIGADGNASGPEAIVNDPADSNRGTGSELDEPSVAATGDGGFVVAWTNGQHPRPPGLTTGSDLFAQRFDANSAKVGPGIALDPETSDTQYMSVKVASLAVGGFVAIWSEKPGNGSTDLFTIHGKTFGADGAQVGTGLSLSGSQYFANIYGPTVVARPAGGFVVAFQGNAPNPLTGGELTGIGLQAFDAHGIPTTRNPILVQASDVDLLTKPNLALLPNGDVAVAWVDATQHAVYSLVFDSSLNPKGSEPTFVGGSYSDFYGPPAIAALADGRFVVGWTDATSGASSAQAQIVSGDNSLYGPQFAVAAPGGGDGTTAPALVQLNTGTLIATTTHQFDALPGADVRALPIALGSTSGGAGSLSGPVVAGAAFDGYVAGGTVFADANGNGTFDAGEISARTTADGLFALAPGATGALVLTGGTDITTGRPFAGRYTAPSGSKVIDALTTLVQGVVASGANVGTAQMKVATALGLSADAALTQVDPFAASQVSASGRAVLLADAVVSDVARIAMAAGAADPLAAFASAIASRAGFTAFDPGSSAAMGAAGLSGQVLSDASAIAEAIEAALRARGTADAGDPARLAADVGRVEVVVQTGVAPDLAAAVRTGMTASVALAYTGAALDAKINGASPGGGATPVTPIPVTATTVGVFRFFDSKFGTHFFTGDAGERDTILATRPDLVSEGVGLQAVDPASHDPNAVPVFRFFDTKFGTHFFTASVGERDQVVAGRPDLTFEGTGFLEHATRQAGDTPVYRFFDSNFGTHFYTGDAGERASIVATRPDLVDEGIGFYAPKASMLT